MLTAAVVWWVRARTHARLAPLAPAARAAIFDELRASRRAARAAVDDDRRWGRIRGLVATRDLLVMVWANSTIHHLGDGAGRFRRVMLAMAALSLPLTVMGLALLGDGRTDVHGLAHLGLALSLAWLALDLARHGAFASAAGRPHISLPAAILSVVVLVATRPPMLAAALGSATPLVVGAGLMSLTFAALLWSDLRKDQRPVRLLASVLTVACALCGAVVEALRMPTLLADYPTYAWGMAVIAAMLIGLAVAEARVLHQVVVRADQSVG